VLNSSDKRVAANQANSKKSTGPRNTTSTRFNATKHGLLSAGVTELDDAEGYRNTLCRLHEEYFAETRDFLLGHIALQMVRLRRTARLEAEQITSILNPAIYGEGENPLKDLFPPPAPLVDPGLPTSISCETLAARVTPFQRNQTSIENSMYRAMNQVERLDRMQQGEHLPGPVAVDVAVHSDPRNVDTYVDPTTIVLEGSQSEPAGGEDGADSTKPNRESS
jgi:hypothetical protein